VEWAAPAHCRHGADTSSRFSILRCGLETLRRSVLFRVFCFAAANSYGRKPVWYPPAGEDTAPTITSLAVIVGVVTFFRAEEALVALAAIMSQRNKVVAQA
jgi:hypothetical protein